MAAYRQPGPGDEDCAGGGRAAGLPPAPGGPTDVQLSGIDARSPIAGLYVRAERVLAQQVRGHMFRG